MKKGISLISLIITIIVIIILAAIVIFSGLNTPDSASFAGFTQQVDNVYQAVMNKYGDLKAKHAIANEYRTDEQIYIEIAVAGDPGQYATMGTTTVTNYKSGTEIKSSTGIQNIQVGAATDKDHSIGMTLPKVREQNTAWYVTKEGKVFNANGYVYDGKTYFSGSLYQAGELPANETSNSNRAYYIYEAIKNGTNIVENAPPEGTGEVITGGNTNDNNGGNEEPGTTSYTVTFNTNGGTPTPSTQTITDGNAAADPGTVTRENYTLEGWHIGSENGTTYVFGTTPVTADITLVAKWTANAVTPTVTNVTHPGVTPVTGDEVTITLNNHTNNYYYVKDNIYLAKYSLADNRVWTDGDKPWVDRANGSYPYDLNNDVENNESEYGDHNPYVEARSYGNDRLRTGRLLTVDEYNYLKNNADVTQWAIIYKNNNEGSASGRSWWLGSAGSANGVRFVNYDDGDLYYSNPGHPSAVRPVIEL